MQDPLNVTRFSVETFDHVKRGLVLDDEEEGGGEGAGGKNSSLRNVSADMKRALGALQTNESRDAFEAGGGGKRAEAAR